MSYDVIVVGGGHAGLEASLAAARLGGHVLLVTHSRREIGRMPCNPAIGGLGKGQLVREIDVLGGEMARAIDATGIQFRLLNRRKGPAVRSPRAQADKADYQRYMLQVVLDQTGLGIVEDDVVGILVAGADGNRRTTGVRTKRHGEIQGARVILSTGTFLRGLMHVGEQKRVGGREGAGSAEGLSGDLKRYGFELRRLKTGTPPRLQREGIEWQQLEPQPGDDAPLPFSFRTETFQPDQVLCHLTQTNARTHDIIRAGLSRSPLYTGIIQGRGPRYCPSIEDKVVRFASKERHPIFLEPEGRESDEIYVNGLATSLPASVQCQMVRSIRGLERAELSRYGYAVEYDSIPSYQVRSTLESKLIDGLYMAGQIIGTSGYEEAAAQGLIAGINSFLTLNNQSELILKRSEAYIGVLIDDLVTKDITEPYRMFTSRAEHRLALRCDNTESRLLTQSARLGLLPASELARLRSLVSAAELVRRRLLNTNLPDPQRHERVRAAELLKRPDLDLPNLFHCGPEGVRLGEAVREDIQQAGLGQPPRHQLEAVLSQVESDIKYEGYVAKQERMLKKQKHLEAWTLPRDINYRDLQALSTEAREKLSRLRPGTLGQASRIDGVRAADLAVLTVILQKKRQQDRGAI